VILQLAFVALVLASAVAAVLAFRHTSALQRKLNDTTQICDLANDPVLVGDIVDGRILYANRAFHRMLGYDGHQVLLSRRIPELHPPELVGRSAERIAEVWETKGMIYSDLPYVDAKGERIDVEISANLVNFGGQQAILIYARDIRERLRHEREIEQHAKELERMNKELHATQAQLVQQEKLASLGNLAAGVAHEMNSPIGTLRANAGVSEKALEMFGTNIDPNSIDPRVKRAMTALQTIASANKSAVDRVSDILKSLQNFARLDEAERKRVNLHDGIESALTLLKHEMKDRITVVREFGELPELECYPGRLNQVYMNLLSNAIAAIDGPGTITVRTRAEEGSVELSFADTGRGIPANLIDKLFDPAFRQKEGRMRAGLGLPTSYRIVSEHGGSIDVKSEVGKGSTFTVRLPRVLPRSASSTSR
jgi:two-component system, NtrC family, sensor kinase